jgi:hypothetical protein
MHKQNSTKFGNIEKYKKNYSQLTVLNSVRQKICVHGPTRVSHNSYPVANIEQF